MVRKLMIVYLIGGIACSLSGMMSPSKRVKTKASPKLEFLKKYSGTVRNLVEITGEECFDLPEVDSGALEVWESILAEYHVNPTNDVRVIAKKIKDSGYDLIVLAEVCDYLALPPVFLSASMKALVDEIEYSGDSLVLEDVVEASCVPRLKDNPTLMTYVPKYYYLKTGKTLTAKNAPAP